MSRPLIRRDGYVSGCLAETELHDRVQIGTTALCPPAQKVFDPVELEARIEYHTRRIARECPELQRRSIKEIIKYLESQNPQSEAA